ncbi:hypothetical protein EP331_11925, partial [bacterium]
MKKIFLAQLLLVLTILFSVSDSNAQSKYAIFIHGFDGNSSSWTGPSVAVPQQWKSEGIITDYIAFDYSATELSSNTEKIALLNRMGNLMKTKSPNGEWIIVGHSLGGIVARAAYHFLKTTAPYNTLNIKAITTIGTPSQGANAAHVSMTATPGFINVGNEIATFRNLIEDPLDEVHSGVATLTGLVAGDALSQLENVPVILDGVFNELQTKVNLSESIPAKDVIGRVDVFNPDPNSLIYQINHQQTLKPQHVRSVIGVEKAFIPIRSANEFMDFNATEVSTLKNYDDIRWFYRANANAYDASAVGYTLLLKFGSAATARRKRDKWNRGRAELDAIDSRWGKIIDSYTYTAQEEALLIPTGICSGGIGDGPGGFYSVQQAVNPSNEVCIDGTLYEVRIVQYYSRIGTKNDGLLTPQSCVWDPGSPLVGYAKNKYYDDV